MNSLRAIHAVFFATRRRVIQTRALAWLLAAVLAAGGLLPFFLRGDGSDEGLVKMMVIYPPAVIFGILLVGTLWSAAALSAQDIDSGIFTSVITKPAPLSAIWLGKWLALLTVNAVLLAVAGTALLSAISIHGGTTGTLDGHHAFPPDDSQLHAEAAARDIASRMTAGTPMHNLLNRIKTEAYRIAPGQHYTWAIPVATASAASALHTAGWSLQFHFHCAALERRPISGVWTLRTDGGTEQRIPVNNLLDGRHRIPLHTLPRSRTIHASFSNLTDSAATAFFAPLAPVSLLQRELPFSRNLFRSFLILFCFLAAVAALGLSLGTLFSFPVAVFTALALLLALALSNGFSAIPPSAHQHGPDVLSASAISSTGEWLLTWLHRTTGSTLQLMPLKLLAEGRTIRMHQIIRAMTLLVLIVPACLCLLSVVNLRQREYPQ